MNIRYFWVVPTTIWVSIASDRLERKNLGVKVWESQELIWILEAITILPAAEIPGSLYGRLPFAYKHRTMAWKLVGGDFWKSKDKSDHLKAVICSGRFPNCMRYRTIASSHSVFEKLFVQLHPKSYYCQFWKSSSLYVQKSPVCTQAPNWLHPGTPSASEDPFKIYYSRPHKRQEQSENLLEMCSPVILGVTTIHVVGEANTYIHFKSMQGGPTQNQNDWFQLI